MNVIDKSVLKRLVTESSNSCAFFWMSTATCGHKKSHSGLWCTLYRVRSNLKLNSNTSKAPEFFGVVTFFCDFERRDWQSVHDVWRTFWLMLL